MKKNVLRIFSLVLYLLVLCTILSVKIEDEMMTEVYTYKLNTRNSFSAGPQVLPMNLVYKEAFENHIYDLQEGSGWNAGLRVQELESRTYSVGDRVQLTDTYGEWLFVALASRQPRVGEPVKIMDELPSGDIVDLGTAPANYLVIYPETVPTVDMLIPPVLLEKYETVPEFSDLLPEGASVAAQGEKALLIHLDQAPAVYTENSAKQSLSDVALPEWQVYSMEEVTMFLRQLPLLAVLAVMALVLPLGLWLYACLLARNEWENRILIRVNTGLIVTLILGMIPVLMAIDLPASLLPRDIIFDSAHYRLVFGNILAALDNLGSAGAATVHLAEQMGRNTMGILAAGTVLTLVIGVGEAAMVLARRRREKRAELN